MESGPLELLNDPTNLLNFVALMLVFIGTGSLLLTFIRRGSTLVRHVPQILCLTFLLPIVLLLSVMIGISKDAVVGLLGVIVGYVFGIAQLGSNREPSGDHGRLDIKTSSEHLTERQEALHHDRPTAYARATADLADIAPDSPAGTMRNIFAPKRVAEPLGDQGEVPNTSPPPPGGKGSKRARTGTDENKAG